ncbi:hypothetical protein [Saccharothrix violaceirubra]|uniref:Uncharacterized protein n=1 Tax=Saccharothrix violaceirubra TaxID=413306 RepID=A0A7W7WWL3_9PSEU|nr:hypothetical protein [Saccharothrix violaceirubra]MBB4965718.1 hypothetical protein [Saccharothrix violaceirubra]
MRTDDTGDTWRRTTLPTLGEADRFRVYFTDHGTGFVADGSHVHVTRDNGHTWHRTTFEATGTARAIAFTTLDHATYLVAATTTTTALYRLPARSTRWSAVPGVAASGVPDGDVTVHEGRVHTTLAGRYWSGARDTWTESTPPCPANAATDLSAAPGTPLFALCGDDPGMGRMHKLLRRHTNTGFVDVSEAPREGITQSFAAVPGPEGRVALTSVGLGATFVHLATTDGTTWTSPLIVEEPPLTDLVFTDDHHGYTLRPALPDNLFHTTDGGTTWHPLPIR